MPVLNLEKGKLEVKNKSTEKAELIIFGEITSNRWGENEVEPQEIKDLLEEIGDKDLDIYINSPGGNFFAGMAIYNMLARHKGKKTVYVEGYSASIASVIAMVGDEIIIPANAYLMIHKSWGVAVGNADELRESADIYARFDVTIAGAYLTRAKEGVTEEKFLELMKAETWLNGKDAQEYFNVTLGEENIASACFDGDLYKNYKLPKELEKGAQVENKVIQPQDDFATCEMELAKAKLNLLINI
ncbi:MAG: head maturation protease, ClpP-related [Fusobacteriaceae bacterium]